LSSPEDRARALPLLQERVKREAGGSPGEAVAEIERALDVPVDPSVPRSSPFAMMDDQDISRATDSGLVDFGAHTVSHPILSRLDDLDLASEMDGSIDAVEHMTGQACRSFAYPNGGVADFDDRAVHHLRSRAIDIAVTTVTGVNGLEADGLRLARVGVGPNTRSLKYAAAAYGLPLSGLVNPLKRRVR
jgi:peptidoglycan/xylan/chitin deacetylase (PgdA/CDA1 family)